ncbi:MAG: hypothetical protein Q7J27_07365 [Syntrophales bacterium]|nr:hypothetical protein [Syntrophales bacterium]
MKNGLFWVFGILQCVSLGCIIFLIFKAMGTINGEPVIGLDTSITLSITFPLYLLIVEYLIYSK